MLYVLAPAPRVSVVPLLCDVVPIDAVALRSGVGCGVISLRVPHVADGRPIVHPGVRAGTGPIAELRPVAPLLAGEDEIVAQHHRRGRRGRWRRGGGGDCGGRGL